MEKKEWVILAVAAVLAITVVCSQFFGPAAQAVSWGLSFQETGQTPSGPSSPEELARYGAAYVGRPEEKVLYLTFDAGYENGYTAQILDVLQKHSVPAAFFLVGNYLEKCPDLVRQMVAQGHIVGNHTASHPDMSKLSDPQAFSQELQALETKFFQVTGKELPKYYRPPQGVYSRENLIQAQKLGYQTVFWSLAYADWDNQNQPTREQALEKLTERVHNGAVILLHSTSRTNAQVLDQLLTRWEEMGYRFETLAHLFES